jgi:uncharacterized protein YgiM (DUF1202 family)
MMKRSAALVVVSLALAGCAPEPEIAQDLATVVASHASVRMKNSSTSRTLQTLDPGDRVEILERQENWYRIRYEGMVGWMEESTVVTNVTQSRVKDLVAQSQHQPPQNTGALREDANFRIEPGRTTSVIRRLGAGTKIEILDRLTTARPGSTKSFDAWLKVRPSPLEVGWVFASLVDFDAPPDISQYTEGYIYAAVQKINQVQDPIAGPINWFVVGERSPGLNPHLDFDGIRVFTWNMRRHRYETAYRTRDLKGVYPLEVGVEGGNPTFRVFELAEDGSTKTPREFVMNGVIVRELKRIS